jgi:hypothetical protein
MTILVEDDNLAGRELMEELLEALGNAWSKRQTDVKPLASSIEIRPVIDAFCVVRQQRSAKRFRSLADLGHVKSALAHLRHSPHANRFAFPCDGNELPGERWSFRVGAVRASPLNRSQSR